MTHFLYAPCIHEKKFHSWATTSLDSVSFCIISFFNSDQIASVTGKVILTYKLQSHKYLVGLDLQLVG